MFLPLSVQLDQLNSQGIPLDLAWMQRATEAVLFAYGDFYVELVVEKFTDEIVSVKCFKNTKRLEPYLRQISLAEILPLLSNS
ncbi:hypothetical protein FSB75_18465 [Flavisolibacter ginsenosidimutans]|uniref:Uncharacterized protein n=2 Tax=Flavisolibacter ginsenosidimutans TaxID=661481 RepID=A0A5B8UN60_9BACT|nr:hypothetical protein [Flavisolibacter ginsenosidimutans]QEC57802.1 hypothetical protein FSB75_18465 [Flavisolibacter ginsenosidimutans]